MPTGYTAGVQTGKITEFGAFAMQCARAFGALIEMRDEPADKPIPEAFAPRTEYHDRAIEEAKNSIAKWRNMSPEQIFAEYAEAEAQRIDRNAAYKTENETQLARYRAMLEKAVAWTPPTTEHYELKNFMISQLEESIRFDGHDYQEPPLGEPDEWHAGRIKAAEKTVEYHEEKRQKEIELTNRRNKWIAELRSSFK